MSELDERINQLQLRLENLAQYQWHFQQEISRLRSEINSLRTAPPTPEAEIKPEPPPKSPAREYIPPSRTAQTPPPNQETANPQTANQETSNQQPSNQQTPIFSNYDSYDTRQTPVAKSDLEKFIGENLISKIGILITFIGVVIGAKYAIDRDLISPTMRILFGYAVGIGLLGFAIRLKDKYLNFSAVLLSGAMGIMYFITFAAYAYYSLIPQTLAFLLMLFFTAFTVLAAIKYDREVIAHVGLVGAYAVPFLLSNDSGRAEILFGYIAIINAGILAVSVKKYWKPLFYSSFIITWAIFYGWHLTKYRAAEHFTLALVFITVFFLIFYLTFLAYKLINKEKFSVENVFLLLANSFVFYGLGYWILDGHEIWRQRLGLFTILNALIHFVVGLFIYRYASAEREVVNLIVGLVLVFITIAAPVQMDGNWVTLIWTAEALILFWIGRTKGVPLYEIFSYPLMLLAVLSLLQDWQVVYGRYFSSGDEIAVVPMLNPGFLTAILFVAAFAFIHYLNRNKKYAPGIEDFLYRATLYIIPAIALAVLYNAFRMEIGNYWHYRAVNTAVKLSPTAVDNYYRTTIKDDNLSLYNVVWQVNYTMLFLALLSFLNVRKIKSEILGFLNLGLNGFTMLIFLTVGLYCLGELRDSYLNQTQADYFPRGIFNLYFRYVSYAFVAALLFSTYRLVRQEFFERFISRPTLGMLFDFGLHFSALWILSGEVINWMDVLEYNESYKLGLSILWGLYAVFLIVLGINRHKKHLRVGAIVLFALTLVKLFLYDIAELDTISKTVVFVSLGVLLLVISFLYNKYKFLIFEESET